MELLYLYIKNYDDIFENQQINFSSNYYVEYKEGNLKIQKNTDSLKKYYGDIVTTITMFHGKNGAGKSTLLDILGMRLNDRRNDTNRKEKRSYFMLYHLYGDYFGFEFSDASYIEGAINNIDMHGIKTKDSLYKPWVGLIFLLKENQLVYQENFFGKWMKNQNLEKKSQVEYAYITRDRYNSRISRGFQNDTDDEYIFGRKYFIETIFYEYLYRYLVSMKNMDELKISNKSIKIRNVIDNELGMIRSEIEDEIVEFLNEERNELDRILNKDMDYSILGEEDLEENSKKAFLKMFKIDLIEYYFLNRLSGWIWNREPKLRGIEELRKEYEELTEYIKKQADREEYYNNILKCVLNKVDAEAKMTVETDEQTAILEILDAIEALPEKYFKTKRNIIIDCEDSKDLQVIKLFKTYDRIYKRKNTEGTINTIDNVLEIILPKMSEGETAFLDTISKVTVAVKEAPEGNNVIVLIDEPDREIHPELARNFIDILLKNLNECEGRTVQVVMTSHSPFIVTDILPDNTYAIVSQKDLDGKRTIKHRQDTFATNIYYLLMNSFMMDNTFGEYSYKTIREMTDKLKKGELSEEGMDSAKKLIDRIGEKTVKKKLLQLYYTKKDNNKYELSQRILNIDDEEKLDKIQRILDE